MIVLAKELGLSQFRIKDLVIINLDTLIQLQDHFDDGKLNLRNCINTYFSYISSNGPETATFPFDEYIKYHFVKTNKENIGNPKDFYEILSSFDKH